MATEMKRYVVGIVMESKNPDEGLELQHHKVQGRSEYESIGYALMKRTFLRATSYTLRMQLSVMENLDAVTMQMSYSMPIKAGGKTKESRNA